MYGLWGHINIICPPPLPLVVIGGASLGTRLFWMTRHGPPTLERVTHHGPPTPTWVTHHGPPPLGIATFRPA